MSKQLESSLAHNILRFLDFKRNLGVKFTVGEVLLYQLDKLAMSMGVNSQGITKELAEKWREKRAHESHHYRYDRVRILIMFSCFLNDSGIESYVPRMLTSEPSKFVPYIFTNEEIKELFKQVDSLRLKSKRTKSNNLISMPCVFRMLYSTGMRIGELIKLRNVDVDLKKRTVHIRNSKNGKERVIPMSDSLFSVISDYKIHKSNIPLMSKSEYFFTNLVGIPCTRHAVEYYFKICINKLYDRGIVDKSEIRIHDLRHSFAVNSLAKMSDAGIDVNASLPILSIYLGHSSVNSTNYYIRLTKSMFPNLLSKVDLISVNVFPNLTMNEKN